MIHTDDRLEFGTTGLDIWKFGVYMSNYFPALGEGCMHWLVSMILLLSNKNKKSW